MKPLILALVLLQAPSVSDGIQKQSGFSLRQGDSSSSGLSLPPGVVLSDSVSARTAAAIALWNNKALESDLAALELSRADLLEAGLHKNFSLSSLLPVGAKPFELLVSLPIEEFWQRKHRIRTAEIDLNVVSTGLVQNGLNLIRDVRTAHASLWLADRRSLELAESLSLRNRIADLTEKRRAGGDATSLDVAVARADARLVQQQAERSRNEIGVAAARLRALMGVPGTTAPFSAVLDATPTGDVPAIEALIQIAMENRPDLRASEMAIEAAGSRAKWERSRVLAMMAPTLSLKEVGNSGLLAGPGLNLELPVFNRNEGPISRADAEVVRAGRAYVALRDQVASETREAHARVLQAREALLRLREETRPAVEEMVKKTEAVRAAGEGTLLEVLIATRLRFDVVLLEIDARADLERALADLERAIGRTL